MGGEYSATILVIDDNPNNLNVLSDFLDKQGFEVLFALDGKTAVRRAEFAQPEIILLDVMMPGIDGFETCRQLKQNEATRDIPIIFMTALNETMDKVKGFDLGAVDYITKPLQVEEVLARLKTHLTLQHLQNELRARNEELETKNRMLADREVHLLHLVEEKTVKIESITITLINALENANLYNDIDTGNHIRRVGEYSAFLAEKYGCDRDFTKRIKIYAPLHDVGKVGLPDVLLKKPGKYTPEEFIAMQEHVLIGTRMLNSDALDPMARNIALYHHEKWDGSGYVNHLVAETIPLEARIVAIADAYDAMVTVRVYKQAFSHEKAIEIIHRDAGKHFDPKLEEIFFKHTDKILEIKKAFR